MKKTLIDKYQNLNSIDIEIKEKAIKYKDKEYSEKDWFNKINSFKKINENEILLQNKEINELPSTIYKFFCENVLKMSFLGLILPQILFLMISFISFSAGILLQHSSNYENFGKMVFFMGILYLMIAIILTIRIIKGDKVYQRIVRGQSRFNFISKKEYNSILNSFEKLIVNECYYIKRMEQTIDGDLITLREFTINDTNEIYDIFKNPNVFKYLIGNELKTIDEAKKYIIDSITDYKNKGKYKLGLFVNNKLIGFIGLSSQDLTKTTCQIIYAIGEEYWHHAYVTKGLSIFIPYLKEKGMEIIYAGHVKENVNSGKVMIKAGFKRCEERDTTMFIHNEQKEIVSYILKEETENEKDEEIDN